MREISDIELKKIQVLILKYIDEFCSNNDINYCLMYGSLLGSIRHNGFIPWDDDVDICMSRLDYNKFLALFPKDQTETFYVRSHSIDREFPFYFSKICIKGSHAYVPIDNQNFDVGISIDLFPLDSIPVNKFNRIKQGLMVKMNRIKLIPHTIDYGVKRKLYKRFLINVLRFLYRKPAYYYIECMYKNIIDYNDDYRLVTEFMTPYGKRAVFPKEWFNSLIRHHFEGALLPVPEKYDLILSQLYGDYMTPPPLEKQKSHHSCRVFIDDNFESVICDTII